MREKESRQDSSNCPSREQLAAFSEGMLTDDVLEVVSAHIEDCVGCRAVLEKLDEEDPLLADLRRSVPAGLFSEPDHPDSTVAEAAGQATPPPGGDSAAGQWPAIAGYEILGELGHGGMGVVYKAWHIALKRLVAIKMIRDGALASREDLAQLRVEAQAVAQLRHANIVQVHEIGEVEGQPFFSLEFCDGGSLAAKLKGARLPPREAAQLVEVVARAMQVAHQRGIIHRDLKPSNILLSTDGQPKISDFGLAKRLEEEGLTQTDAILGTPSYMAPEQAAGKTQEIGLLADVYALGATLYEALTGRPPFRGATKLDTLEQVRYLEPVPPSRLQPKVPRDLETICLKCLRKEAPKRYATAADLADDLKRFLVREPIRARPTPLWERTLKWARRRPTSAALVAVSVLVVLCSIGVAMWYRTRLQELRAGTLVETLKTADIGDVPRIVEDLATYRRWADPLLRQMAAEAEADKDASPDRVRTTLKKRLHASLALLPVDREQVPYLCERLLDTGPTELPVLCAALEPYRLEAADNCWAVLENGQENKERRFQAACALATFNPESPRWGKVAPEVVAWLVAENPFFLSQRLKALKPARLALLEPLGRTFRDQVATRTLVANIVADFAADQPEVLADFFMDADEQTVVLWSLLRRDPQQAKALLERELTKKALPQWKKPPLDPAWGEPDPALVRKIVEAQGMVAERFAFCQSMSLDQFEFVAREDLRRCGYRPICCRPYLDGKEVKVAAVWTRDGQRWELEHDLSAAKVRERNDEWRGQTLHPWDLAGYLPDSKEKTERYAVLWGPLEAGMEDTQLYVEEAAGKARIGMELQLRGKGFVARGLACSWSTGQAKHSGIWWKPAQAPEERGHHEAGMGQPRYESLLASSRLPVDVRVARAPRPTTQQHFQAQFDREHKKVSIQPRDPNARFARAEALFWLDRNAEAVKELTLLDTLPRAFVGSASTLGLLGSPSGQGPLVAAAALFPGRIPSQLGDVYKYRAMAYARLGKAREARDDVAVFRTSSKPDHDKELLHAYVSVHLGDEAAAFKQLEELLKEQPHNIEYLNDTARARATAAQVAWDKDQQDASAAHARRAVELLRQVIDQDRTRFRRIWEDPYLDPIREHPGLVELLAPFHLECQYSAVWWGSTELEAHEAHGLDPSEHLKKCRELAERGYRPAALSVAAVVDGKPLVTVSVWHRPLIPDSVKEALARRQARAAAALLALGQAERVWPLLRYRPDPRDWDSLDPGRRTYLIHRLAPLGADPQVLIRQLRKEKDVSIRRALLLSLGEFSKEKLPEQDRQALVKHFQEMYNNNPDPGIHSAVDWLLRSWGEGPWVQKKDQELAGRPREKRNWHVTPQGHTMVIVRGPMEFWMGSPRHEPDRTAPLENQLHVRIPYSFAIATKEVTVGQFGEFKPTHMRLPHIEFSPVLNGPVNGVSWLLAAQYCQWLSEKEGVPKEEWCYPPLNDEKGWEKLAKPGGLHLSAEKLARTGYRLPTEVEWEYACRAGAATSRYYGMAEELLGKYAWQVSNSLDRTRPAGRMVRNEVGVFEAIFSNRAWPVGLLKPNDLGLFDMQGNVREWCQPRESSFDLKLDQPMGILRGGSFFSPAPLVRSAFREPKLPDSRDVGNGLRVARTYRGEVTQR